jgi:DNA mismatch repair ATPase MutS
MLRRLTRKTYPYYNNIRRKEKVSSGYNKELDELRALQTDSGAFLADLEARERGRTGIPNLRVAYNNVHGFYIEITNAHAKNQRFREPAGFRAKARKRPAAAWRPKHGENAKPRAPRSI